MKSVSLILVEPSTQGNIGAVARSMKNFGFSKLVLVSPKCELGEEARKRAKNAQEILKSIKIKRSLSESIKGFGLVIGTTSRTGKDYNMPRSPLLIEAAAKKIVESNARTAVLLGSENQGLSTEVLKKCDYTITIPSASKYRALNLSHAATIILYELSKAKNSALIMEQHKHASPREKEEVLKQLRRLINNTSFMTSHEKKTQEIVWKKIIGKAQPTKREAYALIGFLKKQK